jgi:hypothetical protein
MCDAGHVRHVVRMGTALISIRLRICLIILRQHLLRDSVSPRRSHRHRTRMLVHADHDCPASLICAPWGICTWVCSSRSGIRTGIVPHDSPDHPEPIYTRLWLGAEYIIFLVRLTQIISCILMKCKSGIPTRALSLCLHEFSLLSTRRFAGYCAGLTIMVPIMDLGPKRGQSR